jgi:hypothetical protein
MLDVNNVIEGVSDGEKGQATQLKSGFQSAIGDLKPSQGA